MKKSKMIGRFSINKKFIEDDFDLVQKVMGMVVVIRCEFMFASDKFEYMAISNKFEEIEVGTIIPEYTVKVDEGGGNINFVRTDWYTE